MCLPSPSPSKTCNTPRRACSPPPSLCHSPNMRNTRLGVFLRVRHLPHPVLPLEHIKHAQTGVFYAFVTSFTLPLISNTRNTRLGVYLRVRSSPPCPSPRTPRSHCPSSRTRETHPGGCVLRVRRLHHPVLPLEHPLEHEKYARLGIFFVIF
jgi:hypothetical protein